MMQSNICRDQKCLTLKAVIELIHKLIVGVYKVEKVRERTQTKEKA